LSCEFRRQHNGMKLSSRKEQIIQAMVESFMSKPQPVSSSEIQKKHLPALSSATIRNELAALEGMGFLVQPHASAGRVPTIDAYKFYVEKLMPRRKLTRAELKIIKRHFQRKLMEIDDVLRNTAKVISEITNLTSIAFVNSAGDAIIENIKIVRLTPLTALIVIVTDRGVLKDTQASVSAHLNDDFLNDAAEFATVAFKGYTLNQVAKTKKVLKEVKKEFEQIFDTIFKILKNHVHEDSAEFVLEGSSKLLEQPEYSNIEKARAMLELLDSKNELLPVLANSDDMSLNILISKDNELKAGMPECAIITANYTVRGVNIGKAGVIGPVRMDYPKVVSVLDHIGRTINLLPEPGRESENIKEVDVEYDIEEDDEE